MYDSGLSKYQCMADPGCENSCPANQRCQKDGTCGCDGIDGNGLCEGDTDGELLGLPLGLVVGDMLGLTDGLMLGTIDGLLDGLLDGLAEGAELGVEGLKDGLVDGNIVGAQSHPLQSYPIASSTSQ